MIHGKVGALFRQSSGEIPRLRRGRLWDSRLWRPCGAPERSLRISDRGTREAGGAISGTVALRAEPRTLEQPPSLDRRNGQ